ncbi:MAG: hypothetical protein AAF441_10505 [Pseudomonadota bacterium]
MDQESARSRHGSAAGDLFDTERYPITARGSAEYLALLSHARKGLAERNCAQLPDFIRPGVLVEMQREAEALADRATYTEKWLNPYFSTPDDDVADDHPLKRFALRRHGMVRGDRFSRAGAIWAAFQNQDLCRFVADCLGYTELHTYRDPYGCVNVNVQPPGREFAWHFDHNDFTVSLGLKQPAEGGGFEYVPDIRTGTSENYGAVQAVLDGDRSRVQTLFLRPGDLQLFRGGYTLHRVTAPVGDVRHSLLFSYVTDPNRIATAEYAQRLWGEVHPAHIR